jgi:prepilin-type N-terminal cleavage/methylation domain-containing protein
MRRGYSLMELMVVLILVGVLIAVLGQALLNTSSLHRGTMQIPDAQQNAMAAVRAAASALRAAPVCSGVGYSSAPIRYGDATTVALFTDCATPATLRLLTGDNGDFVRRVTSASPTTAVLAPDTQVTFRYFAGNGNYFQDADLSTMEVQSLTADSPLISRVIAVEISATSVASQQSATYSTLVRFRNGPGGRSSEE